MLDASGNAVGQWDIRGTLVTGPSQKILVGPDTITGSTAVGALTLQGQPAGGGQLKLDDLVLVRPGLTQFSGPILTPTTAIDFANTLSAQSSGKEFSYLYVHPSVTLGFNNLDFEIIKENGTYTSNSGTTTKPCSAIGKFERIISASRLALPSSDKRSPVIFS